MAKKARTQELQTNMSLFAMDLSVLDQMHGSTSRWLQDMCALIVDRTVVRELLDAFLVCRDALLHIALQHVRHRQVVDHLLHVRHHLLQQRKRFNGCSATINTRTFERPRMNPYSIRPIRDSSTGLQSRAAR
ncbi:No apical meristem-associated C-terminal domain-containing protein [Plasmodiophora brassicae]